MSDVEIAARPVGRDRTDEPQPVGVLGLARTADLRHQLAEGKDAAQPLRHARRAQLLEHRRFRGRPPDRRRGAAARRCRPAASARRDSPAGWARRYRRDGTRSACRGPVARSQIMLRARTRGWSVFMPTKVRATGTPMSFSRREKPSTISSSGRLRRPDSASQASSDVNFIDRTLACHRGSPPFPAAPRGCIIGSPTIELARS